MADLYSSKTFAAAPFLAVTHYDSTGTPAPAVVTLNPAIVARPSVIKFTKDQKSFATVTDKIFVSPVQDLGADDAGATNLSAILMSDNGLTVTLFNAFSSPQHTDVYLRVKGKYSKVNNDITTAQVLAISPDGTFFVTMGATNGSFNVYRLFAGVFVLDKTIIGVSNWGVIITSNNRMIYAHGTTGNLMQCNLAGGYTETIILAQVGGITRGYTIQGKQSPSGKFVLITSRGRSLVDGSATGNINLLTLLRGAGGNYTLAATLILGVSSSAITVPRFDATENVIIFLTKLGTGSTFVWNQYSVAAGGTLTLVNSASVDPATTAAGLGLVLSPPTMQHVAADGDDLYNDMLIAIVGPQHLYRLRFNNTTKRYSLIAGAAFTMTGTIYWDSVGVSNIWTSDTSFITQGSPSATTLDAQHVGVNTLGHWKAIAVPLFDPALLIADMYAFAMSADYQWVFYIRDGDADGTNHIFGGHVSGVSEVGTWVSLYTKTLTGFDQAFEPLHYPAGYDVKNVGFRTPAGTALNLLMLGGTDPALHGRYMADTIDGTPKLVESGKDLSATLVNSYLDFGPDEYFAATHDYSAGDSKLKLFKFSSAAMDFVEMFSISVTFGPLTISNCWDVIIANGDSSNPFTLYKRVGDTLVLQDIPAMDWPDGLGTAVGLVAMEDCSGFTVVTDEGKVIVIEIPEPDPEHPEDPLPPPEIKDVIDLFPLPDPELLDPAEPVPVPQIPVITPVIEIIDGQIIITYPPDPKVPLDPLDPDPLKPSPPIITPSPIQIVPTQKPPLPPTIPPPLPVGQGSGTAGVGLKDPIRGPMASVNISYER